MSAKLKRLMQNRKLYFSKCLKIRDKESNIVAFTTNPSQEKLIAIVEAWEKKYPKKTERPTLYIIILKARQIGFSTATEAIFFHQLHFSFNKVAMVVSYDDDSASTINDMSQRFYNYLPQFLKPLSRPYRGKGLLMENPKFDPNKAISDRNNPGLQNKFFIETARNANAGSSYTINYLHLSEVAKWPGNPKETMTSILQAVPKNNSIVVVESTAKGYNYFKDLWDDAVAGRNDYIPLFVAWHEHAEYTMPYTGFELTQEEKELKQLYNLSNDQLEWRRWCIKNKCSNDPEMFKQEYPGSPEEAFLSTGTPVFANEKVQRRIEQLRQRPKPIRGDVVYEYDEEKQLIKDDTIRFMENENGFLTIYKHPQYGRPYVLGGDIAEGGIDFSSGQVLDNVTGEQVAVWHGHSDTDIYAKQMYCLGKYYNDALIGIEMNFDTHPVKELQRLKYLKQYRREAIDNISKKIEQRFGWRTTQTTRPLIIANLVTIIRENIELINDIPTLQEMLSFIRNDEGRPEAAYGKHDDLVIGLAIAHQIRDQQTFKVTPKKEELTDLQRHKLKLVKQREMIQKRVRMGY